MKPFTFFISYRRQDTAPIALLLKSEIEKRLQFVRVAVDVGELRVGDHFPDRLKRLIGEAHVTVALIGKHWMPRRDAAEVPPRLDDWVERELEYSATAPLDVAEPDAHGSRSRIVLPLFADCEPRFDQFVLPTSLDYLSSLHAEHIAYANWPSAIGPLLDRIAVQLGLKQRPEKDVFPVPDPVRARTQPVSDEELRRILDFDDYEGWHVDNFGDAEARYIGKTFKFRHFNQAADFMRLVSEHCRVLKHHPEWRNVYDHVTVALTTWDARRKVTIYDLSLALYMNLAAKSITERQAD